MIASPSYNRAYLAPVLCTYIQIPFRGTLDTLKTLYAMPYLRGELQYGCNYIASI